MQDAAACESWEDTLRRGAEKRSGGLPALGPGDVIWQTIRCAAEMLLPSA